LIRAAESVRAGVPVFQPQPAALAALASRVKESFDPKRLFNPGRMG
jgi:glycolate oxidase FAD binding subunit